MNGTGTSNATMSVSRLCLPLGGRVDGSSNSSSMRFYQLHSAKLKTIVPAHRLGAPGKGRQPPVGAVGYEDVEVLEAEPVGQRSNGPAQVRRLHRKPQRRITTPICLCA